MIDRADVGVRLSPLRNMRTSIRQAAVQRAGCYNIRRSRISCRWLRPTTAGSVFHLICSVAVPAAPPFDKTVSPKSAVKRTGAAVALKRLTCSVLHPPAAGSLAWLGGGCAICTSSGSAAGEITGGGYGQPNSGIWHVNP